MGRSKREAAGGESRQRGFAKESQGCAWWSVVPHMVEKEPPEPEDEGWLDLMGKDPTLLTSPRSLNSNQPGRAKGSSLICTNFSDKLNLKVQFKCNQQSEPTRKSLASLGATRTISRLKEAREFSGLHQGTEHLLLCHQWELQPGPPQRAPLPSFHH